jgi:hypothetical protein
MTDETWEQVANGLERIDFDALADDEKVALPASITRTLREMMPALIQGECSTKIGNRINRSVSRLTKQIEQWQKLQRRQMRSPTIRRRGVYWLRYTQGKGERT